MVKVRVFNGPNLNLLGQREPGTYGQRSLPDIMQELERFDGTNVTSRIWEAIERRRAS